MSTQQTVMVIEDNTMLLDALEKKLALNGFKVIACLSGRQAFDALKQAISLPDAICLDYYLIDMNGTEFMNKLNRNEFWKDIPVLVLSNADEEESEKTTLALGAKIYMLKTQYKLEDVVVQLRKILLPVE
jgi:DNA-binding response OmpR family regulator